MVSSEGEYIIHKGNEKMDRLYIILQYEKKNRDEYLLFCGHDIKPSHKKTWGSIVHAVHAALRNNVWF